MSGRRRWAWPLVPVYAAGLRLKDALRARGWMGVKRLGWPVVSVGSLSAGGAGKTPVVIALANMLSERGWDVDVLSRGYGRRGGGVERVGAADPVRFGDEPVLIAERAEARVWVGADRFAAGAAAEGAREGTQAVGVEKQILRGAQDDKVEGRGVEDRGEDGLRRVHVLDDGFQHRRLARTVDVVLLTAEDLDDALLPAGNLREGVAALARADVVVIREEERASVEPRLPALLRAGALVWSVRRTLRFPAPLFVFGAGLRPVAFCAIARPDGFAAMLTEAGCGIVETVFFGDHHRYRLSDIEQVIEIAVELKASGFVTTEKDAVKLTTEMRTRLEAAGGLMVVALEAEFVYPERVARQLEARLV